jgi:hypothetical protein
MASGTRVLSIPRFSITGRATSLQHVLKHVDQCDLTSPLYLSVLQHFGGDEEKFNLIDYFLRDQMYFENLSYSETVIENPNEKDPTKVVTRVERYHVPNYLKARCIFFKKFLEDKKNNDEDLNYESFYMGLMLDNFMAWKAEEMTMNTSSPRVAKSRDLVADFKKGIKRDPSLFPSLMYVCFLLNNTWCEAVDDIPICMSTGSTSDISPLLCFHFWEPVYYKLKDSDFLSDSHEKCGHFVGISESVGHAMTFKILTDDTLKVIHQSNVNSALNPHAKNLQLDLLEPGNVATPIIKSRHDSADDGEILPPMPVIDPSEFIGRTFLMDKEDGQ